MVQKTVNVKVKAGLKSSIMVRDANSRYPRNHCLNQNTSAKMQTQGLIAKKSKTKMSRLKKAKLVNGKSSTLPCSDEAVKPNCQEKKKEY